MIHFDFIVTEADAENIFDCIQSKINENNEIIMNLTLCKKDELTFDIYKRYNEYLKSLKEKMTNYQIKETT